MVIHKLRLEDMKEFSVPVDWVTFQGVDPTPKLIETLAKPCSINDAHSLDYITGDVGLALRFRISVPNSKTVAWVAQLDRL